MFTIINTSVIFAFGLVITGIVFLGVLQAREQAERAAKGRAATIENRSTPRQIA